MNPDCQCTLFLDGWPKWLGGTGDEWLHCCVAHDLGASNMELYRCVNDAGFPVVAVIMLAGVSIYFLLKFLFLAPLKHHPRRES